MTERAELWSKLESFPVAARKDVEVFSWGGLESLWGPAVEYPTRLGNILHDYESYPKSRYRIDGRFYFPRLWLVLDDSTRREIAARWSPADALTYLSFIFFAASLGYLIAAAVDYWDIVTKIWPQAAGPLNQTARLNTSVYLLISLLSVVMARICYLISLPLHIRNGRYFKAIFDLYRLKLSAIAAPIGEDVSESDRWELTQMYLDYNLVRCQEPSCKGWFPQGMEKCPYCLADKRLF